jgi:hypothetical protein
MDILQNPATRSVSPNHAKFCIEEKEEEASWSSRRIKKPAVHYILLWVVFYFLQNPYSIYKQMTEREISPITGNEETET